jgi:hypothetical protein
VNRVNGQAMKSTALNHRKNGTCATVFVWCANPFFRLSETRSAFPYLTDERISSMMTLDSECQSAMQSGISPEV